MFSGENDWVYKLIGQITVWLIMEYMEYNTNVAIQISERLVLYFHRKNVSKFT